MSVHMQHEMENLKKLILSLSTMVDEALGKAVKAVQSCDIALAEEVIAGDGAIDDMEVRVEEECLKILALYQPVAIDLRFIVAVLKMNSDLERIGDLAANIAQSAITVSRLPRPDRPFSLDAMCGKAKRIVKKSLDALIALDADLAREVLEDDDGIDEDRRLVKSLVLEELGSQPQYAEVMMAIYAVARRLERIGDHATNIAEDVIYMIEADIVRHQPAVD